MSKRRNVPIPARKSIPLSESAAKIATFFDPNGIGGINKFVRDPDLARVQASNSITDKDPYWYGVVVGHWLCCNEFTKNGRTRHGCISKCGVLAFYEPWEIASGRLPKTCYGCRPGEAAPPSHRVLDFSRLENLQRFWGEHEMATIFGEIMRTTNKEAIRDWDQHGRTVITDIIERTGYGRDFGWKLTIDKAAKCGRIDRLKLRKTANHLRTREVEIYIHPAGSQHEYTVLLSTGRTDYDFKDVAERVTQCIGFINEKKPREVAAAATVAAPEGSGHQNGFIDVAKLSGVANQLAKAAKVGEELNQIAVQKTIAEDKVKLAREKEKVASDDADAADRREDEAAAELRAKQDECDRLTESLRKCASERDVLRIAADQAKIAAKLADEHWKPIDQAKWDAEKELAGFEQMENEQLKEIGNAAGLKALLAALSQIS